MGLIVLIQSEYLYYEFVFNENIVGYYLKKFPIYQFINVGQVPERIQRTEKNNLTFDIDQFYAYLHKTKEQHILRNVEKKKNQRGDFL